MHRSFSLLLTGVALSLLAGCGQTETTDRGGDGTSDKLTIAVIPKSTGAEFWETVESGAREAAEALDIDMKWEGTVTETEIAEQNKIIENMINLEIDGIALAPLNRRATRKRVESAAAAGIPVVIFDSAVDGDAYVSFVATNNRQGGALGAEHMIELLKGKGDIMVQRFIQGTGSTEARAAGFMGAAKSAGLSIVADPYPEDGTVAGCKKTAANTLERFIEGKRLQLDGIFCCNDRASLGMLAAVEDLRKSGIEVNAKFIGFDFTPRLVDSLKKGGIDALIVQNPRKMGYLAVETLVKHLRKETIEPLIDTGVELVTTERLESNPTLRKLVGADAS